MHWMRGAASRADWTAGSSRAISTAMIAITTSNSISVNPRRIRITEPPKVFRNQVAHSCDLTRYVVRGGVIRRVSRHGEIRVARGNLLVQFGAQQGPVVRIGAGHEVTVHANDRVSDRRSHLTEERDLRGLNADEGNLRHGFPQRGDHMSSGITWVLRNCREMLTLTDPSDHAARIRSHGEKQPVSPISRDGSHAVSTAVEDRVPTC